jgi:uncharacterized lipoprotein YmbA
MIPLHIVDRYFFLPLLVILLVLGGCGTTPPSKFYMLEPLTETVDEQQTRLERANIHIGIGPVQFAQYLDRSQIVTRTDSTEVNLSERHRWAEPLQNNFSRILAENLSILLHTDKVSIQPSRHWSEVDYQVAVSVWRFDVNDQGNASLVANWSVRTSEGSELITMKKSAFNVSVDPAAPYSEIARALSKTVEMLSREIAGTIQNRM